MWVWVVFVGGLVVVCLCWLWCVGVGLFGVDFGVVWCCGWFCIGGWFE